ncbi:LysE family translocator [Falsirhodobacter halotolerans]|uniref:LysE family translocator n=1 Tax=Falsirhodobacter halotolerans TaxID=1146892 RepID=UPI001FD5A802|nr:LysE family translocator [Falsirhodobacter halotolerans]MCJ8139826.1 LysE family translocator [Falsirhodobacter halotolerans]
MTPAAFVAVGLIHLAAAASPGPAVLMAARTGAVEGFRTGLLLSVGLGLGAVFWAVAALFGLSVLFVVAPTLLWVFKLLGAGFLIWTGWKMWRHAKDTLVLGARPPRGWMSALRLGAATQLANPKPAIFFGAVFIGLIPPGTHPVTLAALLLVVFVNEAGWNALVARAFSFDRPRRMYIRLKSTLDRVFGGVFALLGLRVATS